MTTINIFDSKSIRQELMNHLDHHESCEAAWQVGGPCSCELPDQVARAYWQVIAPLVDAAIDHGARIRQGVESS